MRITIKDVVEATAVALFNFKSNFLPIETTMEENLDFVKKYFTYDIETFGDNPLSRQEAIEIGAHALRDCINSEFITLPMCREEIKEFLCEDN